MASVSIPGVIPSFTIANKVFTDLSNLIQLGGYFAGAATGNNALKKLNAAAGFTPSVGKAFRIKAIRIFLSTSGPFTYGYCDNDVGTSTNTAPVNVVYQTGGNLILPANTFFELPADFLVPNGKYTYFTNTSGTSIGAVECFGYEE